MMPRPDINSVPTRPAHPMRNITDTRVADAVQFICRDVHDGGGRALLVGGCVRDAALGRPAFDIDIEVFGLDPDSLRTRLAARFALVDVGRAFGVLKLRGLPIDVSLPRRESRCGPGHRGFDVRAEPFLDFPSAAARRDFTFNAMAFDPLRDQWLDPFQGRQDLERRILRHTSDHFADDPLRVLRGMQFAARFNLVAAPETLTLCRTMTSEELPHERIFAEWDKLLTLGSHPARGLEFLRHGGWLTHEPELAALVGCPQDPVWHPEGDVWVHTLRAMDAFAADRIGDPAEDRIVGLAVLCHDLGKPLTTVIHENRIRSPGHAEAGEVPTRAFLHRLSPGARWIPDVVQLVREHLRPQEFFDQGAGDSAIRRLAARVGRIDRLIRVAQADQRGRPCDPAAADRAGQWLLARARALDVRDHAPRPIVQGRHLIALGVAPGPEIGRRLRQCYTAQLNGKFHTLEEGLKILRKKRKQITP